MKKLIMTTLGMVLFAACATAQQRSMLEADENTASLIRKMLGDFQDAWNKQDADKLASYYAEDAELYAPAQPLVRGREKIRATYEQMSSGESWPKLSITAEIILRSGDLLVESGHYTMTLTKTEPVVEQGKFVSVLRKEGRTWKLIRDIFNSDLPCDRYVRF